MKTIVSFFISLTILMFTGTSIKAQDVYIEVPASNIFSRTEFNTVKNVLNTGSHTNWRLGFFGPIWPEIKSTTGNNFTHTTLPVFLPTDLLYWRLASIGNANPPFRSGDTWPPFKWFTSNDQTWYQPGSTIGGRPAGNVAFSFKIPSSKFAENAFRAGNYTLGITHNYGSSLLYIIEFTPNSFNTILTIPTAIQWLSNTPTKYIEINDLNVYRSTATQVLGNLGNATLGNTVDFKLHAKASSSLIHFTSTANVQSTRNISTIRLGSSSPKLSTLPLSANNQTYSTSNFVVQTGNRNNFTLELSISANDFKTHFFEAGTYTFQLNLEAKSLDNTLSALQNTDVTIQVKPLSEITIPTIGQTVDFNFNTNVDYQLGKSQIVPNQIKLSNNETFELYVKSDANFFKKAGIQTDINANILHVGVNGSNIVPLSTTAQQIITSGTPVLDQVLDIQYTIPPTAAQSLVSKEKTTYSINVIYSFTAL